MNDTHPRVRYGLLFCLGRLCTNLEGLLQVDYGDAILDVFLGLLADPVDRVREAAAAALVHFFEDDMAPKFEKRLKEILTALVNAFLRLGRSYVQEQVLAAIATIATHAGTEFLPYYRDIMDLTLRVLSSPSSDSSDRLVGRSMRCASLMGQAVGKEVSFLMCCKLRQNFFKDAIPLCHALLSIQNSLRADDDSRKGYLADGEFFWC